MGEELRYLRGMTRAGKEKPQSLTYGPDSGVRWKNGPQVPLARTGRSPPFCRPPVRSWTGC